MIVRPFATGPQTGLQTCKCGHRPPAAGLCKAAGRWLRCVCRSRQFWVL